MKTETEVVIEVVDLRAEEALANDADGFTIKMFLACSKSITKVFRLGGMITPINQTKKIRNIGGKELEFWLCTTKDKIIVTQ